MVTNSSAAFCRIALAVLVGVVPHTLAAQQCTGGGWGAAADVLGPSGRRVMLNPSTAMVLRDSLLVVGRFALEWLSDSALVPDRIDAGIETRLRRTLGFRIDARNRAFPTERSESGGLPTHAVLSSDADGTPNALWSERVAMGLRERGDSVGQLREAAYRGGRWVEQQTVLPEMARELSPDGAIAASGIAGSRVVVVQDAYPRFNAGWNEILVAHETFQGWFYRRYVTKPSQTGTASVARLNGNRDIVLLGIVHPVPGDGYRVTSWRIPADSVRPSVLPYTLGAGTELANIGNNFSDFPRLFAIGGDSLMAVWYEAAPDSSRSNRNSLDLSLPRALILVAQLSIDGARSWTEVFRRRMKGDVSRPLVVRDGRGGISLFYDSGDDPRVLGGPAQTVHLVWRDGNWQRITTTIDPERIPGMAVAATPEGIVALWSSDDAEALSSMRLKHPRLRIARYEAPRCH